MPVLGTTDPPPQQPLFYRSLHEFDGWSPRGDYDGIVKYKPRKQAEKLMNRGKLLVCHDYKGGYTENSFSRSYTFNFWASTDIFIYFSHHRITIPPPGWISAAHRQGVKILGTLIFEGGSDEDCLRLLVGKFPTSNLKTGQVDQDSSSFTIPLSVHYARLLAALARDKGFDGYLLNFECPLGGSFEQTRALAAWITALKSELLDKVGSHAETIWYDSITVNGNLSWQDRLNSYNLPFFLASTGIFTNYTWRNHYPALSAQYFLSLSPELIGSVITPRPSQKTLQHIYVGIDTWGRGCHGGGGFGAFRALEHISPDQMGLSVAIFGQAWTWESEQDKDGWSWKKWWDYDSSLWVGPTSELSEILLPEMEWKQGEEHCNHDRFTPITAFFPRHPPPDPADICFHTTFCPGTGLSWFVEGRKVFKSLNGWTDVDKQTNIGDMLWPHPSLYWDEEREEKIPSASVKFHFDEAWNAGNSLCLTISCPGSDDELAAYRPLWLPVQSLCLTPHKTYQASVTYKVNTLADETETESALSLRKLAGSQDEDIICNITSSSEQDLANGWTKLIIEFNISPHANFMDETTSVCIGLIIAIVTLSPLEPVQVSILLGELNVSPLLPPSFTQDEALILWADYTRNSLEPPSISGTLSWEIASTFPAVTPRITSPEDPIPAWNCQPTAPWFPSFLYFNIYAQPFNDQFNVGKVDKAIWIGTSGAGWSGKHMAFTVLQNNLPFEVPATKVRFYVQGISDRGEVMGWNRCAFVDVSF